MEGCQCYLNTTPGFSFSFFFFHPLLKKLQKLILQGAMEVDKIKYFKRYPNIKNFHSYDIMSTETS